MLVFDVETIARDDASDYLDPVEAPGNYKNQEAIDRYISEARARQIDKAACAPDLNRIILCGWIPDDGRMVQRVCRDEQDERDALREFWTATVKEWERELSYGSTPLYVTFGGYRFDFPTAARRSQLLNVPLPAWLSFEKYRSPIWRGDLEQVLTFGGALGFPRSLRTYMKLFGLPFPEDDCDGAEIGRLWAAGDVDTIVAHNATDLLGTRALACRVLDRAADSVAAGVAS